MAMLLTYHAHVLFQDVSLYNGITLCLSISLAYTGLNNSLILNTYLVALLPIYADAVD